MLALEWKLYDEKGNLLQNVNCQYDSLDLSEMMFNADEVRIVFSEKKAYILKRKEGDSN